MKVIIYEDHKYDNLYPITYLRPVYELKCGHTSLREKIERMIGKASFYYFMRDYLSPVFSKRLGKEKVNQFDILKNDDLLIINGRLLAVEFKIELNGDEEVALMNNQLVYARIKKTSVDKIEFNSWTRRAKASSV